ncbi:MAG: hypothetical protein ACTSWP_02860 [Candidatus Freyarchaeota archaeon]|nr:hypothetical protein [Candidatus Freyrarchaeum guaymaensis]
MSGAFWLSIGRRRRYVGYDLLEVFTDSSACAEDSFVTGIFNV